jgi:hypothetical protein
MENKFHTTANALFPVCSRVQIISIMNKRHFKCPRLIFSRRVARIMTISTTLAEISLPELTAPSSSVEAKVTIRPTVSRPSVLVSGTYLGRATNFFRLLSFINFRQFRVCLYWAPSLARSWVCSFQFLLDITSTAFPRSESHGTYEHVLLSQFLRLPQPGGLSSCTYLPLEQGSPVTPPDIGVV